MNNYPIGIAVGIASNSEPTSTAPVIIAIVICVLIIGIICWKTFK